MELLNSRTKSNREKTLILVKAAFSVNEKQFGNGKTNKQNTMPMMKILFQERESEKNGCGSKYFLKPNFIQIKRSHYKNDIEEK